MQFSLRNFEINLKINLRLWNCKSLHLLSIDPWIFYVNIANGWHPAIISFKIVFLWIPCSIWNQKAIAPRFFDHMKNVICVWSRITDLDSSVFYQIDHINLKKNEWTENTAWKLTPRQQRVLIVALPIACLCLGDYSLRWTGNNSTATSLQCPNLSSGISLEITIPSWWKEETLVVMDQFSFHQSPEIFLT